MQPIGDMLAGNPQRRTVFHQADIVNIWHFRAANAMVDPAHNIAEDTLCVIVELLLNIFRLPLRVAFDRHSEDFFERRSAA